MLLGNCFMMQAVLNQPVPFQFPANLLYIRIRDNNVSCQNNGHFLRS